MACGTCGGLSKNKKCPGCTKEIHLLPNDPAEHDIGLSKSFCFVTPSRGQNFVENPLPIPPGGSPGVVSNGGLFPSPPGKVFDRVTNAGSPVSTLALRFQNNVAGTGVIQTLRLGTTPNPGLSVAGESYIFSVYLKAPKGTTWELGATDLPGIEDVANKRFEATGEWQRVHIRYTEFSNTERIFFLRTIAPRPSIDTFYVAGFQLEFENPNARDIPSTFIAGFEGSDWPGHNNLPGGRPYRWQGIPHRSDSERNRFTYDGGTPICLDDCGFIVTGITGWNMSTGERISQPYATQDGSFFQDYKYRDSIATIVGRWILCDPSMQDLMCKRQCLVEAMAHRDRKCRDLQKIIYRPYNDCGDALCGEELEIIGNFIGGLEGEINNCGIGERAALQFERAPYVRGPTRRLEGVFVPTIGGNPNATNLAPNATGDLLYQVAYCYQGLVATSPTWTIYAERIDWSGATIQNVDTGDTIQFRTVGGLVTTREYVIISTEPTNSQVFSFDPATGAVTDRSGFLEPGSHISSFQFVRGYNSVRFRFPAANAVTNPQNNGQPMNVLTGAQPPNNIITSYREQWLGISQACCPKHVCDVNEVQVGFVPVVGEAVVYQQPP